MTTALADELMTAVAELRGLFPDWRLGQLVASLTQAAGRDREGAIWDVEDEELLTAARRLIERNKLRRSSGIEPAAADVTMNVNPPV
jgi:hypothetical protein